MKKRIEKALNDKMQVKLPEELEKEAIMQQLESPVQAAPEKKKKKAYAKILIPLAASLALVIGIAGMFPEINKNIEELDNSNTSQNQVVNVTDYDVIYKKFNKMKSEYADDLMDDEILFGKEESEITESMNTGNTTVNESAGGTGADDTGDSWKAFGETNRQEEGVDEGDIIKTDGRYLYVITSGVERHFTIIDCAEDKMTKTADVKFDEDMSISELYVYGNYAVIIGQKYDYDGYGVYNGAVYDCVMMSGDTTVRVYDISDKTAPKSAKEFTQQGLCTSTRMIGSKLYCVSAYNVNLYAENIEDVCIPEITVDGVNRKLPADSISMIDGTDYPSYAIISAYDVIEKGEPKTDAVLGNSQSIYVTTDYFFISETCYEKSAEITKIYKFGYTADGVKFEACGKVPGYLNNQFSLSYNGTHLRVATTSNQWTVEKTTNGDTAMPDAAVSSSVNNTQNALYILDNDMKQVGKVDNLAPGERIKSARYIGDMAYVVTFRQTDPLFAIDLSDPANPKVMGQLKITGFSEYLHPFAENLLIGIGRDGTENGTNGDCKVCLFDVSDPANPTEASKLTVMNGKGYCWTEMGYNHKVYIKISDTDFAVPFGTDSYINSGEHNDCVYIRYRVENNRLTEVARYSMGRYFTALGGTFIEKTFYTVAASPEGKMQIISFNLDTNSETGRISI